MTQQHDYVIENADGASVRNDINDVLLAIAKNNEGGSDPSTTYTFQFYMDTGDNIFKIRNSANNAYINLFGLGANSTTNVVTDVNQTFTKAQRGSLKTQNATTGGLITLDLADNNYFILSDNAGNGKLGTDNGGSGLELTGLPFVTTNAVLFHVAETAQFGVVGILFSNGAVAAGSGHVTFREGNGSSAWQSGTYVQRGSGQYTIVGTYRTTS